MFLHSIDQRFPADVEIPCRVRLIPSRSVQGTQDQLAFDSLQTDPLARKIEIQRIHRLLLLPQSRREIGQGDLVSWSQYHDSLDNILQLADVPRPAIMLEVRHKRFGERYLRPPHFLLRLHKEMLQQLRNIFRPLAQRG